MGDESAVTAALQDPETGAMIAAAYPVYLSYTDAPRDLSGLADAIAMLPPTDQRDNILENISGSCEYILSLASYNQMLAAMGREPVTLEDHELALYTSMSRGGAFNSTLDAALKNQASITVAGENYRLFPELFYDNIVADRAITLYTALIVPDGLFARIAVSPEPFCWNVHLSQSLTEAVSYTHLFPALFSGQAPYHLIDISLHQLPIHRRHLSSSFNSSLIPATISSHWYLSRSYICVPYSVL